MEETTLSLLGKKTEYPQDYAPKYWKHSIIKHPEMDYWVRFNCPEFTSLCPITGQPGFCNYTDRLYSGYKNGREQKSEALPIQFSQSWRIS